MATLDSDEFDLFDDTTPPRSGAAEAAPSSTDDAPPRDEGPGGPSAAPPKRKRKTKSARIDIATEEGPELSAEELEDWRWRLGATARRSAAAHRRARDAARAWERLVARARSEGVPERMVMAAALEADVDLPASE
jgi:hypothetical protein